MAELSEPVKKYLEGLKRDLMKSQKESVDAAKQEILISFKQLQQDVEKFKKDIEVKISDAMRHISTHTKQIDDNVKTIALLNSELNDVKMKFERFKQAQYRSKNLRVSGIPYLEKENLISIVRSLARNIGFDRHPKGHYTRVHTKNPQHSAIRIRFATEYDKMEFKNNFMATFDKNKLATVAGFESVANDQNLNKQIYLNDDLERPIYQAYAAAVKLKVKDKKIHGVFARNSELFIIKEKDSFPLQIFSLDHLNSIVN